MEQSSLIIGLGIAWLGISTALGALPVLFTRQFKPEINSFSLGVAAGIMMAASIFSLLMPAIEEGGIWIAILGFLLGGAVVLLIENFVPHLHVLVDRIEGGSVELERRFKKLWLFIAAIAIHNLPEGLSVGVGFASSHSDALGLAIGIGIQDIPEGFAVAIPLLAYGYTKWQAVGISAVTGLMEVMAALVGYVVMTIAHKLLPISLALSAGAMIAVISKEVIPESHGDEGRLERLATVGLLLGFALMMMLDVIL